MTQESNKLALSLYNQAYDLHYKKREVEEAIAIYRAILEMHSSSQEASFAKSQLENLRVPGLDTNGQARLVERLNRERLQASLEMEFAAAKNEHLLANCDHWQYMILIDATVEILDAHGLIGWEVVSSAAYQTGGGFTFNGSGSERYTVHIQHTLKRSIPRTQSEKMSIIASQLIQLRTEIGL